MDWFGWPSGQNMFYPTGSVLNQQDLQTGRNRVALRHVIYFKEYPLRGLSNELNRIL
jgi:hypothetical protein